MNPQAELTKVTASFKKITVHAEIDKENKRITIVRKPGDVEMMFKERKAETIEGIAKCLLEIAEFTKNNHLSNESSKREMGDASESGEVS